MNPEPANAGPSQVALPSRFNGDWRLMVAWGIGLLGSVAVFLAARVWVDTVGQARFESLARDRREALLQAVQTQAEVLYSVRNFFHSSERVTPEEFSRFVSWPLRRRPELESIAWLPRDPLPASGTTTTSGSSSNDDAGGARREASERFTVAFIESKVSPSNSGLDDYADLVRRRAMDAALDLNEPMSVVVTGPVATNNGTTSGTRIAIYLPVFQHDSANSDAPRRRQNLAGYARSIVRVDELVDSSVVQPQSHGIDVHAFDVTDPEHSVLLHAHIARKANGRPARASVATNASEWNTRRQWTDRATMAGREWMIRYVASAEYREPGSQEVPLAAFAAGLVCTGLAAGWFGRHLRHEAETDALLADVRAEMQQRQRVEQERRELLRQRLGYQVSGFTDCDAALAEFDAAPHRYAMAVVDLNMPQRSGIEVAKALLARRPGLPVVLTTGYCTQETRMMIHAAGVSGVLEKPLTIDELARGIQQTLAGSPV